MDLAPPKRGPRRPKAPDVEFIDAEPVSITDLEARWDSSPDPVSSDRSPISVPIDSSPASSQPLSDRELVFDTAPPPAIGRKPSFFMATEAHGSRSHLFDAAPAPFDPTVPALPVRVEEPELSEED